MAAMLVLSLFALLSPHGGLAEPSAKVQVAFYSEALWLHRSEYGSQRHVHARCGHHADRGLCLHPVRQRVPAPANSPPRHWRCLQQQTSALLSIGQSAELTD